MKKALTHPIPLYVVVGTLLVLGVATALLVRHYREVVYNYNLYMEDGQQQAAPFDYGSWPALSNPDFFAGVVKKLTDSGLSFIQADLSRMKLTIYQNGQVVSEYPILTIGREGSWWETPAGLYQIETKERNHFSSFGHVYQPYSMAFQGNFFIHGWPYYEDGTPVASTYSGGCIRLSTADAAKVFELAKVGMPVLVYKDAFARDNFSYQPVPPAVSAADYMVADLKSGSVLLSQNQAQAVPVASLTKLVTALVATEYINLDHQVAVQKSDLVFTSVPRLKEGQTLTAYQLLFPLLMESSNEAALALGDQLGRQRFVALMNQKAKAVGMLHSTFIDPAGMDEGNVATAEDLFALSQYLYNNRSFILRLAAGRIKDSAYGSAPWGDLKNFNVFADDPRFVGGKVGESTAAKQSILSVFNLEFGSSTRPVVLVALESDNRETDAEALLQYVTNRYIAR